jgi:hypothetical protein
MKKDDLWRRLSLAGDRLGSRLAGLDRGCPGDMWHGEYFERLEDLLLAARVPRPAIDRALSVPGQQYFHEWGISARSALDFFFPCPRFLDDMSDRGAAWW